MQDILMSLKDIQPSQLYISSRKLGDILEWFEPSDFSNYDAIPIKDLNGKIIFTDGHTRAYAAYLKGVQTLKVYWEEDDLDWALYQMCVDWCNEEGIYTIGDLEGRVIEPDEYEILWIDRCAKMYGQFRKSNCQNC